MPLHNFGYSFNYRIFSIHVSRQIKEIIDEGTKQMKDDHETRYQPTIRHPQTTKKRSACNVVNSMNIQLYEFYCYSS